MNHPDLYLSGAVRRWHTHPIMSRFGQTNAEHQWGALMLLLILHPNPDRALMLAVATHDIGERKIGDVPWDAKQDDPGLAALIHAIEDRERQRLQDQAPGKAQVRERPHPCCQLVHPDHRGGEWPGDWRGA